MEYNNKIIVSKETYNLLEYLMTKKTKTEILDIHYLFVAYHNLFSELTYGEMYDALHFGYEKEE